MNLLQTLISLFFALALLALMVSGLVMMVSPTMGQRALKKTAIAIGILILGTWLLQVLAALIASCLSILAHAAGLACIVLTLVAIFILIFKRRQGFEIFTKSAVIAGGAFLLASLAWLASRSADASMFVALVSVSYTAYRIREKRLPRRGGAPKLGRAERTPALPRAEHG